MCTVLFYFCFKWLVCAVILYLCLKGSPKEVLEDTVSIAESSPSYSIVKRWVITDVDHFLEVRDAKALDCVNVGENYGEKKMGWIFLN